MNQQLSVGEGAFAGRRLVRKWQNVKGLTLAKLLILNNFFQNGGLAGPLNGDNVSPLGAQQPSQRTPPLGPTERKKSGSSTASLRLAAMWSVP
jgi:hypothetical protein